MKNVFKAIKEFEKITTAKWQNPKSELNCVYFAPFGEVTRWYFTNTKMIAYGEIAQPIKKELLIPIKELKKIKKIKTFEFVEDGVKIDDTKIKSTFGRYPNVEKILNPENTQTFTLKANFSELGTLLNALKHEVTISSENGELKILQKSFVGFHAVFEYTMPCEGFLPFEVTSVYGIYSLMAKDGVSRLDIIEQSALCISKQDVNRYITFETSFCKFFVMAYRI